MKIKCEWCNKNIGKEKWSNTTPSKSNRITIIDTEDNSTKYFCNEKYDDIDNYCYLTYQLLS